MQTPKSSKGSLRESPQKVSVQPTRQLKISPAGQKSPSSSTHTIPRTPKDGSPKVADRRSPRSPLPEKKRPSKLSELESQVSKLQEDLVKVRDQLIVTESSKRDAQADAEDLKRQLADMSLKLEQSQEQISELVASKETSIQDLENIAREKDREWERQVESAQKQQSDNLAALSSAQDEIQRLKLQLETVAESRERERESTDGELKSLKENLAESLSLIESLKQELKGSRETEAQAEERVRETLLQLAAAEETVSGLRSDVSRSTEAYNAILSELEQSRARASFLEDLVNKLNADVIEAKKHASRDSSLGHQDMPRNTEILEVDGLESELQRTKREVVQLESALEAAEIRYNEERLHNSMQIKTASDQLEQLKSQSSLREAQLEAELKGAKAVIDELKANIMDKETELQGISDENERLTVKLETRQREEELENEVKKLMDRVEEMKEDVMVKTRELESMSEENEMLKQKIKEQETNKDVEESRATEQEAMEKLGCLMEEADKSNRKAARAAEQLEAAQAANAEMESELRKLKIQSDQWRKAAEAAASMLERTTSHNYNPSPTIGLDDYDDDESFKKKNGSVLKKIGVLWKKPQK